MPIRLQIVAVLCLFLVVSCASRRIESSGFLPDYDGLTPISGHNSAHAYQRPDLQRGVYQRLLVDDVRILLANEASSQSGNGEALENLANSLRVALVLALQENFALVSEPGPGVLRVSAALTHVRLNRALLGVVPTGGYVLPFDLGASCFEVKLTDAVTDEPVAALLDSGFGQGISWGRVEESWHQPRAVFRSYATYLESILRLPARNSTFAGEE